MLLNTDDLIDYIQIYDRTQCSSTLIKDLRFLFFVDDPGKMLPAKFLIVFIFKPTRTQSSSDTLNVTSEEKKNTKLLEKLCLCKQ